MLPQWSPDIPSDFVRAGGNGFARVSCVGGRGQTFQEETERGRGWKEPFPCREFLRCYLLMCLFIFVCLKSATWLLIDSVSMPKHDGRDCILTILCDMCVCTLVYYVFREDILIWRVFCLFVCLFVMHLNLNWFLSLPDSWKFSGTNLAMEPTSLSQWKKLPHCLGVEIHWC